MQTWHDIPYADSSGNITTEPFCKNVKSFQHHLFRIHHIGPQSTEMAQEPAAHSQSGSGTQALKVSLMMSSSAARLANVFLSMCITIKQDKPTTNKWEYYAGRWVCGMISDQAIRMITISCRIGPMTHEAPNDDGHAHISFFHRRLPFSHGARTGEKRRKCAIYFVSAASARCLAQELGSFLCNNICRLATHTTNYINLRSEHAFDCSTNKNMNWHNLLISGADASELFFGSVWHRGSFGFRVWCRFIFVENCI